MSAKNKGDREIRLSQAMGESKTPEEVSASLASLLATVPTDAGSNS